MYHGNASVHVTHDVIYLYLFVVCLLVTKSDCATLSESHQPRKSRLHMKMN